MLQKRLPPTCALRFEAKHGPHTSASSFPATCPTEIVHVQTDVGLMSLARNIVRRQLQQAALPHTIQDIADGVLREPLIHLPSLILLFATQPSRAMQYPQLLTLFFRQFEGTPPLNRLTEVDEIRVRVARMALDGITVAQHADYESETAKSVLDRYTTSAWPSIWKWMHFLYYETGNGQLDTTFDAGSRPTIKRLPIMNQIQGLLSVIIQNRSPALFSAIVASHGMLKMVTEIWVRHCDRPPSDTMFRYSSLLSTTLSSILNSRPADLPDLEEGFGVGPLELARLLLKPLRSIRIVQGGQARFISEHDSYIFVYLTFREKHQDIFRMLLANGILNDILYALSVLLCLPPPIPPKTRACIATCFDFVFMATALHVDYTWVIDAVHLKLVQSLLKQAISLTDGLYISEGTVNDEPYYFRHIIHIFERFVIHRPVLKLFEKVVRSESVLLLWSKVPAGSLFRTQWSTFLDYLNSLANVKASFDQSENSKMNARFSSASTWSPPSASENVVGVSKSFTARRHVKGKTGKMGIIVKTVKRIANLNLAPSTSPFEIERSLRFLSTRG